MARFLTDEQIGQRMTITAATANQFAQGLSGIEIGIPSDIVGPFREAVGGILAGDWEGFALGTARAAIDLGLEAMGSIPVIGWAARLALSVVDLIRTRSAAKAPPPPQIRYDKTRDEELATMALWLYSGHAGQSRSDLRAVFMPPARYVTAWRVEPRSPGFVVEADGDTQPPTMGIIPGFGIAVGDLISLTHWGDFRGTMEEPIRRTRSDVVANWDQDYAGTITTTGDLYPSLRRVGASLWSMVSCTRSAQAFELDTRGIPEAWGFWEDSAIEAAADAFGGGVKLFADRVVGFEALIRSTRLDFFGVDSSRSVAEGAERRIKSLRRLQRRLLDSLVVAFASENQAAFRDPKLAELLDVRRRQLLRHPARWRVDLRDIPDLAYRDAMRDATPAGDRPIAAALAPQITGEPFEQEEPPGLAPLGEPEIPTSGAPSRRGGLPAWAWAALAAAGLFAASRRR